MFTSLQFEAYYFRILLCRESLACADDREEKMAAQVECFKSEVDTLNRRVQSTKSEIRKSDAAAETWRTRSELLEGKKIQEQTCF